MPPSGSSTSPLPVRISICSASATIISASRFRRYLSVRQSLASSTAERSSWPLCVSSFFSSRSNKVKASAVAPAKPPITLPRPSLSVAPIRRTFFALGLITVDCSETWPSPAITALPFLRTPMIVVPCHTSIDKLPLGPFPKLWPFPDLLGSSSLALQWRLANAGVGGAAAGGRGTELIADHGAAPAEHQAE